MNQLCTAFYRSPAHSSLKCFPYLPLYLNLWFSWSYKDRILVFLLNLIALIDVKPQGSALSPSQKILGYAEMPPKLLVVAETMSMELIHISNHEEIQELRRHVEAPNQILVRLRTKDRDEW